MAETVLVIGGLGFIGRRLVALLRDAGCGVRIMSRQAGCGQQAQPGIAYIRGEVADAEAVLAAARGPSAVYDLSMPVATTWAEYQRLYLQGAANVAAACAQHGVRRLIYTSSIAALNLGLRGRQDENAGVDPKPHTRDLYSRVKIESERLLLDLHARAGLPVVIVRPGIVVGPGGMLAHFGAGFWRQEICCQGWGNGKRPLPFVLVDDVARAMVAAKDAPGIEGKTFNLAGDVRLTAREYVAELAARSRRNYRIYPEPLLKLQVLYVMKWLVKAALRKPGNAWPYYRDLKCNAFFADLDCSQAKRLLGWQPMADREAFLREAIDSQLPPIPPGDLRLEAAQR